MSTLTEHQHQTRVMKWARANTSKYLHLQFLYAIPNGGHRNKRVAAQLKAEGVKQGVSDLHLPVSRSGYHGLWIEMKGMKGYATQEQKDWIVAMSDQGYAAVVCRGHADAVRVIEDYLEGKFSYQCDAIYKSAIDFDTETVLVL